MIKYYQMETDQDSPHYSFVLKFKELWELLDKAPIEKFISSVKWYDLYPLRNVLEESTEGTNRFTVEQMADAGEAFGELLDIIYKDLATTKQNKFFTDVVRIPIEKEYTCAWGKQQTFPLDDNCMMLILIADSLMADYTFTQDDEYTVLQDMQGRLPTILNKFLTKDLDFHQKEHLRACRYSPKDWDKKMLKIKEPDGVGSSRYTSPDVLSINLTWQQSSPKDVLTTLNMIPSKFNLSDMFEVPAIVDDKTYYFKGMIWYWGLHYFCFIRHITDMGEFWVEYNDKEMFRMPSWEHIVDDWVRNSSTPTLLLFENVDSVDYPNKIKSLKLSSSALDSLKQKWFKSSRAAKFGRVDLGVKGKNRDIEIEGSDPFWTHSDSPAADGGLGAGHLGSKYSQGKSIYGVDSHKTKVLEDNWNWHYCGMINEEGR